MFAQVGFKGETKRVLKAEREENDRNLDVKEFAVRNR